ncbi:hypothetical protein SAMN05443144_10573 [Fodinibius roseus]|uniref:Uncharacterized protein n=1 Tax=Fodinibius roseus TaxID=1194090 RepID=A0A1M4YIU6_9BACT|nr:hypothetical protein SAMN05443144_10573 [Fodinibius roseus]
MPSRSRIHKQITDIKIMLFSLCCQFLKPHNVSRAYKGRDAYELFMVYSNTERILFVKAIGK